MTKENTVKSHRDFDRIIQQGARIKTAHFRLHYLPSSFDHTRIGIAVGKGNGGAVTRVRIKRQVRAMLAKRQEVSSTPLDIIVVVRPEFAIGEYHTNEAELLEAFQRIEEARH